MATNKLTYILSCPGYGDRTASPLGESSFKVTWKLIDDPGNPRYGYDVAFTGSLKFTGPDFQWLYEAETTGFRCSDMFLQLLTDQCGGMDDDLVEILEGTKINLAKGTWNLDRCEVTIPVISPDPYECLNERKVDQLNMFDVPSDSVSVRLYDYVPTFEYSLMEAGEDAMNVEDQHFKSYPNRRAEYPGFGCEGEEFDPYYYESSGTLFDSEDLRELHRNPVTFEEILSTGSTPQHIDYPGLAGAFDAVANGWRLHYFHYRVSNTVGSANTLNWFGRWRWVREIKDVAIGTPMPDDWVYVGEVSGMDRWARPPVMVPRTRVYKSSEQQVNFPNSVAVKFFYTNYIVGADTNIVNPNEQSTATLSYENIYGLKELPNGKLLNSVISYAFNHCCPGLTVKSEFFQINPDVVTSTNYVTGELSFVDKIVLFQKSDVKRPWASEHTTVGTFTTDELLQWLLMQFKVKYCIFGNVLRIEHCTSPVYIRAATINLTTPPYNRMLAGTSTYTYEIDGLHSKETFSFQEARKQVSFEPEDDFAGVPILYYGACVNRKENENVYDRRLARITNDVMFILINSGGAETRVTDNETSNSYKVSSDVKTGVISDDGFCFVASRIGGDGNRYGVVLPSILNSRNIINNVLGWAFLHDKFYRSLANSNTGNMNLVDITFDSVRYIKKQIRLPFTVCCVAGFDPYEQIISSLGTGIIKNAEWMPHNQTMSVELLFQG